MTAATQGTASTDRVTQITEARQPSEVLLG